jgi:hypothetical protein
MLTALELLLTLLEGLFTLVGLGEWIAERTAPKREEIRYRRGHCPRCDCELTRNRSGVCPACGLDMEGWKRANL